MLNWPLYDTKRNRRSIALKKRQIRYLQIAAKEHDTQRFHYGHVLPNGRFYSTYARLSALVDPAELPSSVNRGQYWQIVRRHRLTGLNPHPLLP